MEYCTRCVLPANTQPSIEFDDRGICISCLWTEYQNGIDWKHREKQLQQILEEYQEIADQRGNDYDCVIPVSGGKDSHYQVYLLTQEYDMNPLLVSFNHTYNTKVGLQNLRNLVRQFDCDLIRGTPGADTLREISRYMLKTDGDITWPYHAGIYAFSMQTALKYDIPLMIFGEGPTPPEAVEIGEFDVIPEVGPESISRRLHGQNAQEMLDDPETNVTREEIAPYRIPDQSELKSLGFRGIYLGSYVDWDALENVKLLVDEYGFQVEPKPRDRTFNQYEHIDDHAQEVHDYLKFLKYGYGRGTDHAHYEVAAGRMTREQAIELAERYDSVRPDSLDFYLDFLGITEEEFEAAIDPMRDPSIWERDGDEWVRTDSVGNHVDDAGVEEAAIDLVPPEDRTFGANNNHLYASEDFDPIIQDDPLTDPSAESSPTIL